MRRLLVWATGLTVIWVMLFARQSDAAGDLWNVVDDRDGVTTWQQDRTGSEVIAFRGETVIDAKPELVLDAMADNDRAPEWMPNVAAKRTLRWIGKTSRIEYTRVDMPWPLDDRYFVARAEAEYLPDGTVKASMRSVENSEVTEPDKVLGVFNGSIFWFRPVDDGRSTALLIEIHTDMKGLIPIWLVNRAQRSWPHDFLLGLKGEVARRKAAVNAAMPVAH